jgi:hypothetical protein
LIQAQQQRREMKGREKVEREMQHHFQRTHNNHFSPRIENKFIQKICTSAHQLLNGQTKCYQIAVHFQSGKTVQQICQSKDQGSLKKSIGKWIVDPSKHWRYLWYIHKDKESLLVQENNQWWIMRKSHSVQSKNYFVKRSRMQATIDRDYKN